MIVKILVSLDLKTRVGEIEKILSSHNLKNPHPDLLYFEDEQKLGVEQAKQIREFLSLKPYQAKGRGVVVVSSQNFTIEAQNSLLKTLEEPPEESLILLGVDKEESLLPTILSRCQVEYLVSSIKYKGENNFEADIKRLQEFTLQERFEYIEKLEEKEEFLKALIDYFRDELRKNNKNLIFAKLLLKAEEWQKAHGNLRAILEYLMFYLPS